MYLCQEILKNSNSKIIPRNNTIQFTLLVVTNIDFFFNFIYRAFLITRNEAPGPSNDEALTSSRKDQKKVN